MTTERVLYIPPEFRNLHPDGTQYPIESFAEDVTPASLQYFLVRMVSETIPEGTQGVVLLQCVADRLQMSFQDIQRQLRAVERELGSKPSEVPGEALSDSIILDTHFMGMRIPERPVIMSPWLKQGMLVLVSAARGVGKTWFGLSVAVAITRGLPIGSWETVTPVPCLYVDGEMAEDDLQKRLQMLTCSLSEPIEPLYLLSAEMMHRNRWPSPNLSDESWRSSLYRHLENSPFKMVVLDNLASLTPGLDENIKQDWDPVNQWLLSLRFLGIAVIMLHHTGKVTGNKATQRGTSSREDAVDVSIVLKPPSDKKAIDGCRFNIDFTKSRGVHGAGIASFCFSLKDVGNGVAWSTDSIKTASKDTVIVLLGNGVLQKEIPAMLGIDKGAVSRIKTMAVKDEIIAEGMRGQCSFTEKGRRDFGHVDLASILR